MFSFENSSVPKKESEKKRTLEEIIAQAVAEGRKESVGDGSTSTVEVLRHKNSQEKTPWIIKTRIHEPPSHQTSRSTFETEWKMHQKAYNVLHEISGDRQKWYAKIPVPIATVNSENAKRMILEFVDGETLFERALRNILLRYESEEEHDAILKLKRNELVTRLSSDEYLGLFPSHVQQHARWALRQPSGTIPPLSEEHFDDILDAGGRTRIGEPLISKAQYGALERTIKLLHENNISHGDLHPSNIMIRPNGEVVVIDFGLAKRSTSPNAKGKKEDRTYLDEYKKIPL